LTYNGVGYGLLLAWIAVGLIIYFAIYLLIRSYVIAYLWTWFVSPIFNIREISIPEALGMTLIVLFINIQGKSIHDQSHKQQNTSNPINYDDIMTVVGQLSSPLFILAVAWLVHTFVMGIQFPRPL
jgi:hypothetical protein